MVAPPCAVFAGWVGGNVYPSQTKDSAICKACLVTLRLHRCNGAGYMHFVTTSCYQRRPLLGSAEARDLFLKVLEQVRRQYGFVIVGYVAMPEHVHLLISEPRRGSVSTVMQAMKQSFARRLLRQAGDTLPLGRHVWQRRYYDFVVFTRRKRVEKLRYIHRNPAKRGLVSEPDQWRWSSYRYYAYDERGPVLVNEQQTTEIVVRKPA